MTTTPPTTTAQRSHRFTVKRVPERDYYGIYDTRYRKWNSYPWRNRSVAQEQADSLNERDRRGDKS